MKLTKLNTITKIKPHLSDGELCGYVLVIKLIDLDFVDLTSSVYPTEDDCRRLERELIEDE